MSKVLQILKKLKEYGAITCSQERANLAILEIVNQKKDITFLIWCLSSMFISLAIMCFICYDKNIENEQLIAKHNSALIELNAKIESKEAEIKEAQEWMGIVFEEGEDITNKYNELKKQCKKVK